MKMIVPIRSPANDAETTVIGKTRSDHGRKHIRIKQWEFVKNNAIEINAPHTLISGGSAV
jgi:hypothetical protein